MVNERKATIPDHLRGIATEFKAERFLRRAKGDYRTAEELSVVISHLEAAAVALKAWSRKYEPKAVKHG